MKIEILHQRDPDGECSLTVYVNGKALPDNQVYVADVDPGASGSASNMRESAIEIETHQDRTPAFRQAAAQAYYDAAESKYAEEDEL